MFDIVPGEKFIADYLAKVTPVYKPRFKAVAYRDIGNEAVQHDFLVKQLLVAGEKSILAGAPQAGKSFAATDLAMSVCRAVPWMGKMITRRRGVVYLASESSSGVINLRMPAYKKHYQFDKKEDFPIVFIVQKVNLFDKPEDVAGLISDIKFYASEFDKQGTPLGLVVIDTFSASTPGADEIKSADVSRVISNVDAIREQSGAHVMVVHHMNAEGSKVRGHSSLIGDFDTVLLIAQTQEYDRPSEGKGRPMRTLTVLKQKDGEAGYLRKFVLRGIDLGFDTDGVPVSSCVVDVPENITDADLSSVWKEPNYYNIPKLKDDYGTPAFHALVQAVKRHGRPAPKHIDRAPEGAQVVTVGDWLKEWVEIADNKEEDATALRTLLAKRRDLFIHRLLKDNVIGKQMEWVWRTSRKVNGFDKSSNRLNPGPARDKESAANAPRPEIDSVDPDNPFNF